MNLKKEKIIYYTTTGLLTLLMLMSVGMYLFNYEMMAETFTKLGYPSYIVYPLAVAKLLGLIAIWTNLSNTLKEWAYAGFFFDFVLALSAHINIADGEQTPAIIALILLSISYYFSKKLNTTLPLKETK